MSATHRTAAESKADHIAKMGQLIGSVYDALWQEIAWLNKRWHEYEELFGVAPSRIDLLNESAPSFFRVVQDALWEDILLHLARLTDSPRSMGKYNLSVRRLAQLVSATTVGPEVEALTATSLITTEFARDWRNRRIAHRDLELALNQHAVPLAPASRAAVKEGLASLAKILNAVANHYLDSSTQFEFTSDGGGAISLLYVLRDGKRHAQERHDRIKGGQYRPDDLRPDPL